MPTVKESSDELNPTVVVAQAPVPRPRGITSAKDYLALSVATCGVGYLPVAPGTWGSLLAVGWYLVLRLSVYGSLSNTNDTVGAEFQWAFVVLEFTSIAVVVALGVWGASRTERVLQIKDPSKVVVDEVAGQLIALLAVPIIVGRSSRIWLIVIAFLLFRFFDIVKPYPARRLESLHGGWGIMADDLVAGVYAALAVAAVAAVGII